MGDKEEVAMQSKQKMKKSKVRLRDMIRINRLDPFFMVLKLNHCKHSRFVLLRFIFLLIVINSFFVIFFNVNRLMSQSMMLIAGRVIKMTFISAARNVIDHSINHVRAKTTQIMTRMLLSANFAAPQKTREALMSKLFTSRQKISNYNINQILFSNIFQYFQGK